MATVLLFGSTGLTGFEILKNLLLPTSGFTTIQTISRRALPLPPSSPPPSTSSSPTTTTTVPPVHQPIISPTSTNWPSLLPTLSPHPNIIISALGSTLQQSGTISSQWKIDHDLPISLAKAASSHPTNVDVDVDVAGVGVGVDCFIIISSGGTRDGILANRPYSRMKVGVEDELIKMGFQNTIILRPGFIMGERGRGGEGGGGKKNGGDVGVGIGGGRGWGERALNSGLTGVARGLGWLGMGDWLAVEAKVVANATTVAAKMVLDGKAPAGVWVLEQKDICRLGKEKEKEKEKEDGG